MLGTSKKQPINWRTFAICFFIALGQFGFGYPSSVNGFIIVNPYWGIRMGLLEADGTTQSPNYEGLLGATNGVYQAGAVINSILTVVILDRYGRKVGFYWNSLLGLFGGALSCGSMNIAEFIVARAFLGASAWGFLTASPILTAELAPPSHRGFFVGLNGFCIAFSYALAGYVARGFVAATDLPEATWRGPLGVYLFIPLMLLMSAFFAPESPRWLLMKGRVDEARKIVYSLHRIGDNLDFAKEEFDEMSRQAQIDLSLKSSWLSMFTLRHYRKRVAISCLYSFLGQSTAVLVINNYGPTFYGSLGYGMLKQLDFQVGWLTVSFPFCFLGAWLMDRAGRRPLMITGIAGCGCCVIVLAAATANIQSNPESLGALGVAALYCFIALYSVGVDVGGNVFYAEVFPNHVRSKGVSLANMVLALSDLLYLQVSPTAQAEVGWKWFLLFIILSGLGSILLYFVLPETKGVPLEELGHLFGDPDADFYASVGARKGAAEDKESQSPTSSGAHVEKVKEDV